MLFGMPIYGKLGLIARLNTVHTLGCFPHSNQKASKSTPVPHDMFRCMGRIMFLDWRFDENWHIPHGATLSSNLGLF